MESLLMVSSRPFRQDSRMYYREAALNRRTVFFVLLVLMASSPMIQAAQSTSPTQNDGLEATINEFANADGLNDPEAQLTINLMCGKGVGSGFRRGAILSRWNV